MDPLPGTNPLFFHVQVVSIQQYSATIPDIASVHRYDSTVATGQKGEGLRIDSTLDCISKLKVVRNILLDDHN